MVTGLRVMACVVDVAIAFFSLPVLLFIGVGAMNLVGPGAILLLPLLFAFMIVWPAVYFTVPTAILGCTLVKWICRLRVRDIYEQRPVFWRALGREALKLVGMYVILGALIALIQALNESPVWYDRLCRTDVVYVPRLSANQRQFRRAFPNQRRGL